MPAPRHLALVAIVLASTALASNTQLNVKPGAWELTLRTTMNGNPIPAASLAQMSPEQRTKIQAAMQARSGKTTSRVFKECLTAADLKNPDTFGKNGDDDEGCRTTVISESPTQRKLRMVCTGDNPHTGTGTISAPSPTQMTGVIDIIGTATGAKIHIEESGRWLGANCAGIKD